MKLTQGLLEVIDYISNIKLPTVIKIEEVHKVAIYKALKELDNTPTDIEVIQC